MDAGNQVVGSCISSVHKNDSILTLGCKVASPDLWTAETPALYSARITLKADKNILYSTTQKFGFRTIEIRQGDGIYLNGTKIKMKGINRHAFWPETGRCLNDRINLDDVKLIGL